MRETLGTGLPQKVLVSPFWNILNARLAHETAMHLIELLRGPEEGPVQALFIRGVGVLWLLRPPPSPKKILTQNVAEGGIEFE